MVQLLVVLRRLGCEASSGSAVVSVAQLFGIGESTVVQKGDLCFDEAMGGDGTVGIQMRRSLL